MRPVSPGASVQAQKLLCYLHAEYGCHILSGQEESTWVDGPEYEMDYILRHTGKLPAIRGMDFGQEGVAERAIAWWNAGGISQIGYHMGAPTHPDTYEATKLSSSIDATLTPGTSEYKSFLAKLDAVAVELQKLEDANVPVLWRPFHEAGGTWFWWSKEGPAAYIRLWTFVFEHFTKTRGLGNLVWLFPYNGKPDAAFYPGPAYVDIAGADTYAKHRGPLTPMFNATQRIVGPTMPIALHENGPIPDPDQLQSSRTPWLLFNTWHTTHIMDTSANPPDWLRTVYNHDYVITRDELPSLR